MSVRSLSPEVQAALATLRARAAKQIASLKRARDALAAAGLPPYRVVHWSPYRDGPRGLRTVGVPVTCIACIQAMVERGVEHVMAFDGEGYELAICAAAERMFTAKEKKFCDAELKGVLAPHDDDFCTLEHGHVEEEHRRWRKPRRDQGGTS